jgi:hypothetical protein
MLMFNDQSFGPAQDLFEVSQDGDGSWFYHNPGSPRSAWEGGFATREQAERAAASFAYRLQKGNQIELVTKARVRTLIHKWCDQLTRETSLPREDVLLDIRLGAMDALDDLCPQG